MSPIPFSKISSRYATCSAYSNEDLVTYDPSIFQARFHKSDDGENMPYRLFVPQNYAETQKYPLVVYLHGGQGRGVDNLKQISGGNTVGSHIFTNGDVQNEYPHFVLVPQTQKGWHPLQPDEPSLLSVPDGVYSGLRYVLNIIDELGEEFNIDLGRLYFVGQSLGALGVWDLITKKPDVCAAAIPIDGHIPWTLRMNSEEAFLKAGEILARKSFWFFYGELDEAGGVNLKTWWEKVLVAIQDAGGEPRYTEYIGAAHATGLCAYTEPELFRWLFSQCRIDCDD